MQEGCAICAIMVPQSLVGLQVIEGQYRNKAVECTVEREGSETAYMHMPIHGYI